MDSCFSQKSSGIREIDVLAPIASGHTPGIADRCLRRKVHFRARFARTKVDQFEIDALKRIDQYIAHTGLSAPAESVPRLDDGYRQEQITELELKASGISVLIWATGYSFDYSLVKLPVLDADGYPIQRRGVTDYEGLYFLGMPWLHNRRSGILFGVGDDAAHLAAHIVARERESSEVVA